MNDLHSRQFHWNARWHRYPSDRYESRRSSSVPVWHSGRGWLTWTEEPDLVDRTSRRWVPDQINDQFSYPDVFHRVARLLLLDRSLRVDHGWVPLRLSWSTLVMSMDGDRIALDVLLHRDVELPIEERSLIAGLHERSAWKWPSSDIQWQNCERGMSLPRAGRIVRYHEETELRSTPCKWRVSAMWSGYFHFRWWSSRWSQVPLKGDWVSRQWRPIVRWITVALNDSTD